MKIFADGDPWLPLLLCALCVRWSSAGGTGPEAEPDAPRLPGDTAPVSYDLWFNVTSPGAFAAVARIRSTVGRSTSTVALNARDLNVTDVSVTYASDREAREQPPRVTDWTTGSARRERMDVRLDRTVRRGSVLELTVRYKGQVRTDGTGLCSTAADGPYDDGHGLSIMTQFKPTYARRAFPCYDEPSYKATFNISVVKRKDQIALSNMPVRKTESQQNNEVIYFATTPPMSTYLVAIYVGGFVPNRVNDSNVTVYTSRDHADQSKYILTNASKHLDALSRYTEIKYTLPKIDLLAVPDLSSEAMESWGLNTYREDLILADEESKTKIKIHASEIVQHEFALHWFGNLVTCLWWDDAWLNEGFAQYFQYFATKMVYENWPMEEWFLVEMHQGALAYDQLPRHPITSSVHTSEEIEDVFDDITYKKAASVLRMLRCLVTEELFQESLKKYLSDLKKNVSDPNDLYECFDNVLDDSRYELNDGMTTKEFMSNWTLQSGYPVLHIKKNEYLDTFLVTQSRFFIKPNEIDNNTSAAWHIGLTYTLESENNFSDTRPSVWTNKSSKLTEIPTLNYGWYIFNIQSTGFYRVNYDVDNWNALIYQLNEAHEEIHVLNRAQLIDDAFNLARAGYLDYSIPLELSKYLVEENNTTPWYSAMNSFSYLIERMPRSKVGFENIKTHFSELVGSIYRKLENLVTSGNNDFDVNKAWDAFSAWACRLENADCVKNALEYFEKWISGKKIPADIKDAALCVGVKHSTNPSTFNKMFDLYTKTTSYSEKTSIESALGCSTNRTQLKEYINHILDGPHGPINKRNYRSVITAISVASLGRDVLYEFLSINLNKILDEVSDGEEIAKFIYEVLATKVTNDDEIKKIRNLKNNLTGLVSLRSSFEKSFEKVIDNQLWFDTYADKIIRWAKENKKSLLTFGTRWTSDDSFSLTESEELISSTSETTWTTHEPFTSTGSEELFSSTSETIWTTEKSFTSTGSEELFSSTSETIWTTEKSFTSTGSEELFPSTAKTTWTTHEPSTTPVACGSSHVHYSLIIISIFTTIALLVH